MALNVNFTAKSNHQSIPMKFWQIIFLLIVKTIEGSPERIFIFHPIYGTL